MLQIVHKLGMVEKDTDTESAEWVVYLEFDRWLCENLHDEYDEFDEIVIDCRIVEVSKARESPAQRAAASSKSGAAAALESSDCDSDAEEDPAVTRHALGMGAFKIS